MAVPKKKTSKQKKRQRHASNSKISPINVVLNDRGEPVLRHHISAKGFYKGKRVMPLPKENEVTENDEAEA